MVFRNSCEKNLLLPSVYGRSVVKIMVIIKHIRMAVVVSVNKAFCFKIRGPDFQFFEKFCLSEKSCDDCVLKAHLGWIILKL